MAVKTFTYLDHDDDEVDEDAPLSDDSPGGPEFGSFPDGDLSSLDGPVERDEDED